MKSIRIEPSRLTGRQLRAAAVVVPGGEVQRAVRAELDGDRVRVAGGAELAGAEQAVHAQQAGAVVTDARLAPPVLRAVEQQPRAVVVGRPLGVRGVGGVVLVDRARDRLLRARPGRDAEARRMLARALVPDVGAERRAWEVRQAGVVGRLVRDRARGAVEARAGRAVRERVAEVAVGGRVVTRAQRPAVEARLGHAVPLDDAGRSARGAVGARVGAVVTDDHRARVGRVGQDAERVAEAHGEDLGLRLGRPGREHVARGDAVGRAQRPRRRWRWPRA